MNIQMVDLKSQYLKIKSEIDQGIQAVIDETAFIKGGIIKEFEQELQSYLDVKHVIACANGTDALQIAMMALDLKPGDEIILPVFTYVATAEVIALLGLVPVMVDVNPDDFTIDISLIQEKISPKTKAIVPVHLFGQCANMEAILQIAREHNLFVIEDTAQALGSKYTFSDGMIQRAGTIGDIGTTSFFPSKNLGCYGDGGALMTNNNELAEKLRMICNHGQKVQYIHDVIGVNSRLDTIQAAILRAKLKQLNEYERARQWAALKYDELLKDVVQIKTPKRIANSTHVFHQYTVILEGVDRDTVRAKLKELGVPSMVYYPTPLHVQKAFQPNPYRVGSFPVSEQLCKTVLSLPMHTEMNEEMIDFIVNSLKKVLN
jgi:dTDP-4-amino-4,6-dideoxygalactose transaminase